MSQTANSAQRTVHHAKDVVFPTEGEIHYRGRFCTIIGQMETPEGPALVAIQKGTFVIEPDEPVEILPRRPKHSLPI